MFKKIKIQLVLLLFTSTLVVSCLEDEGNYTYSDINEVQFEGFEDTYSFIRFENFNIEPQLVNTIAENNTAGYSYKWQAYQPSADFDNRLIDLSEEKNLSTIISLIPGDYTVFYTVKDLDTEVEFQYEFDIEVVNNIYEGWLVLNDVDGAGRLDMVSLIENEYKTQFDVLNLVGSELELNGTPEFVYTYPYKSDFYGIYVSTSGNGTVKLEPDTFSWNPEYNISKEFVSVQPEDLKVDHITSKGSQMAYTIADGNVYYYFGIFSYNYSAPINSIDGLVFEAAPFIGEGSFWGNAILYDNTNKRFVRTNFGRTSVMPTKELFDYNTGKDLEYMVGSEYNNTAGAQIFAILKDPVDSKKYLAVFNATSSAQSYYGEVIAPGFDKATSYAFSPDFGYLFYAAEGKVYQYDFSLQSTKLMVDKGSDEITLIKFQDFFNDTTYSDLQSQLIVCSYDGTEGTMELYSVPPVNGQIELETTFTGFSKIKSVSYRER
jgi:hypothetical protein